MKKSIYVSMIGAGEIGKALGTLVRHTGASVKFWDVDPKKVRGQSSLKETVRAADAIFFCLPSWILRSSIHSALPFLSRKTLCVFVSKGLEEKTRMFVDEVALDTLSNSQPFALLSGPMLAEELIAGKNGAAVVATAQESSWRLVKKIFRAEDLCLEKSRDTHDVAVAGVLKNVYAIAIGIAAGLGWGENRKGWLCVRALCEMIAIAETLQANPLYTIGQAGLGDFIATGFSRYSANQTLGRELALKTACAIKSEGCVSIPPLARLLGERVCKTLPILSALRDILEKKKPARAAFEKLFCA